MISMSVYEINELYKEGKVSKENYLVMIQDRCFITDSSSERIECLNSFSKLTKDKAHFKFIENIAISDEDVYVRIRAIKIIVYNYPKQFIKMWKYLIENITILKIGLAVYNTVSSAKYSINPNFKDKYLHIQNQMKNKLEGTGIQIEYLELIAKKLIIK